MNINSSGSLHDLNRDPLDSPHLPLNPSTGLRTSNVTKPVLANLGRNLSAYQRPDSTLLTDRLLGKGPTQTNLSSVSSVSKSPQDSIIGTRLYATPTTNLSKAHAPSTISDSNPKGREMSSYTFLGADGELYEISYGVKTANGSIQKCIAPESYWKAHADQLKQVDGLLEPGTEKNITIKKDASDNKFKLYSNNNYKIETSPDSDLYKTYFSIPQYGARESANSQPDISSSTDRLSSSPSTTSTGSAKKTDSKTFDGKKSLQIMQEAEELLEKLIKIDDTADFDGLDRQIRLARKLTIQMHQINSKDLLDTIKKNDKKYAKITLEELSDMIGHRKKDLLDFIENYYNYLRDHYTNPSEITRSPVGIQEHTVDGKKGRNNCAFAATVQLYANNKMLSEACEKLLPEEHLRFRKNKPHAMVRTLSEYAEIQKSSDLSKNVKIHRLRPILNQAPKSNSQEDPSEFILQLHGKMDLSDNKIKKLPNFAIQESQYKKENGMDSIWITHSENGNRNLSPIFATGFDQDELDEVGIPSLERSLGTSFSALKKPTESGMLKLDGNPPMTILIYTDRAGVKGTVKIPMDVPLYCRPEELFGAKDDDSSRNISPFYTLQGFISHDLNSKDSGHYVTYLQHKGKFYLLNGKHRYEIGREEYLFAARTASLKNYSAVRENSSDKKNPPLEPISESDFNDENDSDPTRSVSFPSRIVSKDAAGLYAPEKFQFNNDPEELDPFAKNISQKNKPLPERSISQLLPKGKERQEENQSSASAAAKVANKTSSFLSNSTNLASISKPSLSRVSSNDSLPPLVSEGKPNENKPILRDRLPSRVGSGAASDFLKDEKDSKVNSNANMNYFRDPSTEEQEHFKKLLAKHPSPKNSTDAFIYQSKPDPSILSPLANKNSSKNNLSPKINGKKNVAAEENQSSAPSNANKTSSKDPSKISHLPAPPKGTFPNRIFHQNSKDYLENDDSENIAFANDSSSKNKPLPKKNEKSSDAAKENPSSPPLIANESSSFLGKLFTSNKPHSSKIINRQNHLFDGSYDNYDPLKDGISPILEESPSTPLSPKSKSEISPVNDLLEENNPSKGLLQQSNSSSSNHSLIPPLLKQNENRKESNQSSVSPTTKKTPSILNSLFHKKPKKNPAAEKLTSYQRLKEKNDDEL